MKLVYPVIHYLNDQLTIEQADLAKQCGADGIFLISHNNNNEQLAPLGTLIKNKYPTFKVGLNLLGDNIINTANIALQYGLDMIWGDYCGVSSNGLNANGLELKEWKQNNKNINIFASVAFKYQQVEHNPSKAALEAQAAGFIPTTSGSGTGFAPTIDKIKIMSTTTGGLLAIASGMTCDNINEFKPFLSHILIATGISYDEHRFDPAKLQQFIISAKS